MKKIIILLLLLAVVVSGIYIFLSKPEIDHSYQSFIPEDAQIVLTQYDLEKHVEEFKLSPLGIEIDTLKYDLIGREFNLSETDISAFLEFKKSVTELFSNQLFKTLFGVEVTCALLPFTYREDVKFEDQLLENLLVISRPKHGAKLIDVARWFDFSTQAMSTSRYGSHKITRYDVEDGRRISGVRMNELLVMSFNESVLRKSLDVYDSKGSGLFKIDSYTEHIDRFSGASLIVYADFQNLSSLIEEVSMSVIESDASMSFDKSAIAAYRTGLFGAWRQEDRIVDQAIITFSPEQLDENSINRLQIPAQEPRSHTTIGSQTILYHWTNQFDFDYLVKMLGDTESTTGQKSKAPLDQVLSVTGLSLEQLAELFTGDMTLAVNGLKENQLVPLPLFLLSVKSRDIELLKASIDKMISHYSIPVRRKNIGVNGELITWGGMIGIGSVLPAFAFNEDVLIISSNRDEIKKFILTAEAKKTSANRRFTDVSNELLQPSNSITYVEFSQITEMIIEMASWGGTMIAIKDRELAKKSKVLIDELINPILRGLTMYDVIASRKYIEGNTIIFKSQTILDNGQQ